MRIRGVSFMSLASGGTNREDTGCLFHVSCFRKDQQGGYGVSLLCLFFRRDQRGRYRVSLSCLLLQEGPTGRIRGVSFMSLDSGGANREDSGCLLHVSCFRREQRGRYRVSLSFLLLPGGPAGRMQGPIHVSYFKSVSKEI